MYIEESSDTGSVSSVTNCDTVRMWYTKK